MSPTVWITRAEPGASATAARIEALGFAPLVAPVLTVKALLTPIDLTGAAALAFSSANGVEAFAARSGVRDLPVFAVGDATAEAARAAGFIRVASADGDVAALAEVIKAARPTGAVLHPGPRQRAGDLIGALAKAHIPGRAVDLYETVEAPALPPVVRAALDEGRIEAVLIHSPRAAEAVARLAGGDDLSEAAAFGLSQACLDPLEALNLMTLVAAEAPREDALLAALLAALGNPPRPR